jgi:hypothetical protein
MESSRLLRLLRIAVTALGLTACVMLVALWVRSYWCGDRIIKRDPTGFLIIGSLRGNVELSEVKMPQANSTAAQWSIASTSAAKEQHFVQLAEPDYSVLGFHFIRRPSNVAMVLPLWMPLTAIIGMVAILWIPWSRRFSLRTLLIATTLVAVGLGIVVALS